MNNEFSTIDTSDLDNVTGGRGRAIGEAVKKGAQWAWRNVVGPMGGGAAWEAASQWISGRGNQQQPQQPAQQPPAQGR